ncbi:hypothetical protein DFH07DRAFT_971247 [Mycena maculata]|uniref:Small ribosomal subunit protein mS38 n=1 Tax=Mycena maculata TaxID=230809 RepID=A0AAD7MMP3_9AGAR|nr:hypothetical protein DFH07DRAFT_971247 [Mycena maculata]
MSAFTRQFLHLHTIPAARRSYSSFFSKPGGGRYFNSHKPAAKPVVAANSTKEPAVPSQDADPASAPASGSGPGPATQLLNPDDSPTSVASPPRSSTLVPLAASAVRHPEGSPSHPVISPKDFQLHQFFSIHRPLLLLSNPPSIFSTPPPSAPLFYTPPQNYEWHSLLPDEVVGHSDDSADSPVDDADTARQLTRGLTMARVEATVSWESTLRRLGVDVESAANDLRATEWNQEWEDILADSVKRKRRKKMKKHKLRKLRKSTRASRLKLK